MFESKLAGVLNTVLGSYVHGIRTDDLSVAVFAGDVVLSNLRMKVEALNALGLPFRVRSGVVGKLTLKVPWRNLGKSPVVVLIEDLHVVAGFAETHGADGDAADTDLDAHSANADKARSCLTRELVDAGELAWLSGGDAEVTTTATTTNDTPTTTKDNSNSTSSDGYFAGMLDTILGNLEVSVRRIHLRLEGELGEVTDVTENSSHSSVDCFAFGVTLESLELHTVNTHGDPVFSTKGLAERMRKSATLNRLAVYFDVGAETLRPRDVNSCTSWDDVTPDQLIAVMRAGVEGVEGVEGAGMSESTGSTELAAFINAGNTQADTRNFLLAPVSASALYERRGKREFFDAAVPAQRFFLKIDAIDTRIASSHLRVAFDSVSRLERHARRAPHAHLRPVQSVKQVPKEWFVFAINATVLERRRKGHDATVPLELDRVVEAMKARRVYVDVYSKYVKNTWRERPKKKAPSSRGWFSSRKTTETATKRWPPPLAVGAAPELDAIEMKLPANLCVLFRALAHAQVRRELGDDDLMSESDTTSPVESGSGGYFSGWFGSSKAASDASGDTTRAVAETEMSEDDWSNLQRVFDVEGHAEVAATAASTSTTEDQDGIASEFSVVVGAASVAFIDDEVVLDSSETKQSREREVLRAGLVGFVAGSRAFGGTRADHRATVEAMDVDVSGTKMVHVSGEDANRVVSKSGSTLKGSNAANSVASELWCDDDDDDVLYDDNDDEDDGKETSSLPKALRVKFLNQPVGDDAPDIAIGMTLAPAHVVALRAPIDRLVETLGRHKPAQLAEQEEMLRRAVTESASRTAAVARERLNASLSDRPEINLQIVVHAPRIAAPSFAFGDISDTSNTLNATAILDLGRFQLDSCSAVELGASPDTAKLFNAFKITVSDVSASVASGVWDPSNAWSLEMFTDVTSVIPSFGARTTALQALAPVPGKAQLSVTFDADAVRLALSPKRITQLLAVVNNVTDSGNGLSDSHSADPDQSFTDINDDSLIDYTDEDMDCDGYIRCEALVVTLGRLRWTPSRARITQQGETKSLEVLGVGESSLKKVTKTLPLADGGALRVSLAAAGRENAIAVCSTASAVEATVHATKQMTKETSDDASYLRGLLDRPLNSGRVVMVGFGSESIANKFRVTVNAAARGALQSAMPTLRFPIFPQTTAVDSALETSQTSVSFSIVATLAEMSVVVAADTEVESTDTGTSKPTPTPQKDSSTTSLDDLYEDADEDDWWSSSFDTGAESVLIRATLVGVKTHCSMGDDGLFANVSLAAFDVFDEHARSHRAGDEAVTLSRMSNAAASKSSNSDDAVPSVLRCSYVSIPNTSPLYAGVDVDIDLAVGALCFSARRPTLAALASIPSLLKTDGDGSTSARDMDDSRGIEIDTSETPESTQSTALLETGKNRVATRVKARIDAFRVALMLDDADELFQEADLKVAPGCVADLCIDSLDAELVLFPSTLCASASMGSLRVVDPRLPIGHPCRVVVHASEESLFTSNQERKPLVSVSYETFDTHEASDGADAKLFARVNSLKAVYLARFVTECGSFVDGYFEAVGGGSPGEGVGMGPETTDTENVSESKPKPTPSNKASKIRIDVALAAPLVVIPRGTNDFERSVEVDMGSLVAKNAFVSMSGQSDDSSEKIDRTEVTLTGVNVNIVTQDEQSDDDANPSIKKARLALDPVAVTATVERVLDVTNTTSTSPSTTQNTVVRAALAPARLELSSADFKRLAGCFEANSMERAARIATPRNPVKTKSMLRKSGVDTPVQSPDGKTTATASNEKTTTDDDNVSTQDHQGSDTITARFLFAAELAELVVFRGDARREELACLSLGEFTIDAAVTSQGATLADVSVGTFSLEDRRSGRRRPVAGGGVPLDTADDEFKLALPLLRARYASSASTNTNVTATLQRFTLTVDPTFLLDVGRVFVPSLAGGGGESPEDVLPKDVHLLNGEVYYVPPGDTLNLDPTHRLLADSFDGGVYELDGNGSVLFVEKVDHNAPLIFVGPNSELRIRNVIVEIEASCDEDAVAAWAIITRLAPGARLTTDAQDGVRIVPVASRVTRGQRTKAPRDEKIKPSSKTQNTKSSYSLRAVRLELRVLGDDVDTGGGGVDKLELDFGIDARADLETSPDGTSTETQARLVRLSANVNGAPTLAPLDVLGLYVSRTDSHSTQCEDARVTLAASPVAVALSIDRLATVQRVTSRLAAAAARAPTIQCVAFRQTWSSVRDGKSAGSSPTHPVPFESGASGTGAGAAAWSTWRPHPPPGYASLGDVVGDGGHDVPPSAPSLVIRDSPAFTAPPVGFEKVDFVSHDGPVVWRPVAPPGFVALGVVCGSIDTGVPSLDVMRCVRKELVAAAVGVAGRASAGEGAPPLWVVDNAGRTVVPSVVAVDGHDTPAAPPVLDLRMPTGLLGDPASNKRRADFDGTEGDGTVGGGSEHADYVQSSQTSTNSLFTKTVVDFDRVWWSYNSGATSECSVWRPRLPIGWHSLGDVAVNALEPPPSTVIFKATEVESNTLSPLSHPVAYERVWRDTGWRARGKRKGTVSFWRPVPRKGYVFCGHVCNNTHAPPPITAVMCLRHDLAFKVPLTAMGSAGYTIGGRGFRGRRKNRQRPPSDSFWTADGAGFKLGRELLQIWKPRAPFLLFPGEDDPDEHGWLATGGFHAVAGDAASDDAAPAAFAPRASAPFSFQSGIAQNSTSTPKNGTQLVARLEQIDTTLFVEEGVRSDSKTQSAHPLAKLALRRVSVDARSGENSETSATLLATLHASHRNKRVGEWEPIVEPWEVAARYENTGVNNSSALSSTTLPSSHVSESRPIGSTFRVEGATPLRVVATRAFAEDLVASITKPKFETKNKTTSKDMNKEISGVVNRLGVPVFVRLGDGGSVLKTRPGDMLPHVGFDGSGDGSGGGDLMSENGSTSESTKVKKSVDDTEEPTYLLVDVLETRNGNMFDVVSVALEDDRSDASSVSIPMSIHPGKTTGSLLLDVGEWRTSVRRNGRDKSNLSLRVGLALSLGDLYGFTTQEGDSTSGNILTIPAIDLFQVSVRSQGWYPHGEGVWVGSGDGDKNENENKRVRVRVRLVEGLNLRALRATNTNTGDDTEASNTTDVEWASSEMQAELSSMTKQKDTRLRLRRVRGLELAWWSKNSGAADFSAWRPSCPPGYAMLGSTVVASLSAPEEALVAPAPWLLERTSTDEGEYLTGKSNLSTDGLKPSTAPATTFHPVFKDGGSRLKKNPTTGTLAIWRVIAPEGYIAVGYVVTGSHTMPDPQTVACIRSDLTTLSTPAPAPLWTTEGGESKLGGGKTQVYRTGVAAGAGWLVVSGSNVSVFTDACELRWDAESGAIVLDETSVSSLNGDGSSNSSSKTETNAPCVALSETGPWTPVSVHALGGAGSAATVIGGGGSVVVVDRTYGCLRAPVVVVTRDVPFNLQARLVRVGQNRDSSLSFSESNAAAAAASFATNKISPLVEVYESERFFPIAGWLPPKSPFDEFFTARYGDVKGSGSTSHFADVALPQGYRWVGPWQVDRDHDVDDKGWAYGVNWVTRWPPPRGSHKRGLNATRRRRWVRRRALIGDPVSGSLKNLEFEDDVTSWRGELNGDSSKSSSLALPLGCGDSLAGGSSDLALDIRIAGSDADEATWAFEYDVSNESAGVLPPTAAWPVPVGRLGSAAGKGPWLASCLTNDTLRFATVAAELDSAVSSVVAVDALRELSAYRLVVRAPVVVTNALPCALQFSIVRDADGVVAAQGVASPGVPVSIFDADPRVPSRLELVPVDSSGTPTGACVKAIRLFGDALDALRNKDVPTMPSEVLVQTFAEGSENSQSQPTPLRFSVAVDRADSTRSGVGRPGAPASLVVDVRAYLVVANGTPFDLCVSSFAVENVGSVTIKPGAQQIAATPETELAKKKPSGKSSDDALGYGFNSSPMTPRLMWIGVPGGPQSKVSVEPGAPPVKFAITTETNSIVELFANAAAWAPTGVSAAAPRPTLRVCVFPTLAILNLSTVPVAVCASDREVGAVPQVLNPGSGPTPVHRGFQVKDKRNKAVSTKDDSGNDLSLCFSFGSEDFPSTPGISIHDIASSAGGVLISLPGEGTDGLDTLNPKHTAVLRASVESTGEGCRLLVLRGGDGAAAAAAANVRVENKSGERVWVRQTRRETSTDSATSKSWTPTSVWVEVTKGACVPWTLEDPARFEAEQKSPDATVSRQKSAERSAAKFAGEDVEDENHEEEEENATFEVNADSGLTTSEPAFVEVCVGDDPTSASAHAVVSVPADVARGENKHKKSQKVFGDVGDNTCVALLESTAVRRRYEANGVCLEMVPASRAVIEGYNAPTDALDKSTSCVLPAESTLELSLPNASLSLVDGSDEILFMSLDGVELRSSQGLGLDGGSNSLEVIIAGAQVDDPHPKRAFPIVAWHDPKRGPLLRATLTSIAPTGSDNGQKGVTPDDMNLTRELRYPAMCVTAAPGGIHFKVHESFLWRLVGFSGAFSSSDMDRKHSDSGAIHDVSANVQTSKNAKSNDLSMRVDLFRVSPLVARLTFKPSSGRRPPSVGPGLAATLSMLHLDRLKFEVGEYRKGSRRIRGSQLVTDVTQHVKSEATKQALAVLASVNHLSNVAGTLERAGETIRGLSGGNNASQNSKVGDSSDDDLESNPRRSAMGDAMDELTGGRKNVVTGALVGGGELVGGVLGGVGGIFTKSIAGFKKSGLQGLVDGAARGVVGAATSTAAGAVGFAARVVEGVEATVGGVQDGMEGVLSATDAAAFAAARPRRAPLAVRGDGVVRVFSERDAEGARLLRVASNSQGGITAQGVVDTLNPLNLGNTLQNVNAAAKRPFAGGRFEDVLVLQDSGKILLLSHRHVGIVVRSEERVEWILGWCEICSMRIDGSDASKVTVQARDSTKDNSKGSGSTTWKTVDAGSSEKALEAFRTMERVWTASRAAAARRGGGAGGVARGGGVF